MKICASFSYQCGLEICPTEISKLFLIKITSRSLICNKSQSLSLQVFTFYKKIRLPTPEEEMQISCRFFFTATVQPDALDW